MAQHENNPQDEQEWSEELKVALLGSFDEAYSSERRVRDELLRLAASANLERTLELLVRVSRLNSLRGEFDAAMLAIDEALMILADFDDGESETRLLEERSSLIEMISKRSPSIDDLEFDEETPRCRGFATPELNAEADRVINMDTKSFELARLGQYSDAERLVRRLIEETRPLPRAAPVFGRTEEGIAERNWRAAQQGRRLRLGRLLRLQGRNEEARNVLMQAWQECEQSGVAVAGPYSWDTRSFHDHFSPLRGLICEELGEVATSCGNEAEAGDWFCKALEELAQDGSDRSKDFSFDQRRRTKRLKAFARKTEES